MNFAGFFFGSIDADCALPSGGRWEAQRGRREESGCLPRFSLLLCRFCAFHRRRGRDLEPLSSSCEARLGIEGELTPRKRRKAGASAPLLRCFFLPFAVSVAFSSPSPIPSLSFSSSLFQTKEAKLTTPSAVRVSRLARWSNWNTPSPREPVQRSSVYVSF